MATKGALGARERRGQTIKTTKSGTLDGKGELALTSALWVIQCKDFGPSGHSAKLAKTQDIPKADPEGVESATATVSVSNL